MFSSNTTQVSSAANYIEDVFSTYLYTGNGSTQTINNGIALGTAYGGSVYFGDSGYLSLSSSTFFTFGTGDFSVEAWVYKTDTNTRTIFSIASAFGLITYPSTAISLVDSGGSTIVTDTAPFPLNQWVHVACTRQSGTVRLFVNGTLKASATNTTNFSAGTTYVGMWLDGANFKWLNKISNLRVVKGTALYTATFTVPTAPLTAVSGTSLLICQAPNPLTDNSGNNLSVAVTSVALPLAYDGPFTDSTAGKGGLVWVKGRSAATANALYDTARGAFFDLASETTAAQTTQSTGLTSFLSTGFSLGALTSLNTNAATYTSWTFRKQPKFFDVLTYTGDGTNNRNIAHSLGSVPGCIMVKRTDSTSDWLVYHVSAGGQVLVLNSTFGAGVIYTPGNFGNGSTTMVTPTSTVFTVGGTTINASGGTYVAYIFAHNAGGFGLTGTDNVISCGSFTTDGAGRAEVTLGYEAQWVLIKVLGNNSDWHLYDAMRGMSMSNDALLFANSATSESATSDLINPTSTGFAVKSFIATNLQCIYIAIRRGPMKVPTDATKVFSPIVANAVQGTVQTTSFPIDFQLKTLTTGGQNPTVDDRLRGNSTTTTGSGRYLTTNTSSIEVAYVATTQAWDNTGFQIPSYYASSSAIFWSFRRAPQFSDVVCWTAGSNVNARIAHNLTIAPELLFVKQRNVSDHAWACYSASLGIDKYLFLNFSDKASSLISGAWGSSAPTSTDFGIKETAFTTSGAAQVAYLFATCPGVSSVGSYTGNGGTQTINCGFTGGARFVLIKCTSATGDWYVYDTARGMTAAVDPYLILNSTTFSATLGSVTTVTTGFAVNAAVLAAINTNGASYIYLAIA